MQTLHASNLLRRGRTARRRAAAGAIGFADLTPYTDVEQSVGAGPGAWQALSENPQFLIHRHFPAGWARIRLKMTASTPGRLRLLADVENGPAAATCLLNIEVGAAVDFEGFVCITAPVSQLRLSPLDRPGNFRVELLRIEPLTGFQALCYALISKVRLLRKYWHTKQALVRALRMVLRGDFARLGQKLFQGLNGPDLGESERYDEMQAYEAWRLSRRLTDEDRDRLRAEAAVFADPPLFSVLLLLSGNREHHVHRSIESVLRQTYPHWELCILCDGLLKNRDVGCAGGDPRVRIMEAADKAAAATVGLAAAKGNFVTLLDEGDELAEHALSKLCQAVVADPRLDMLYADEDRLTSEGRRAAPFFKPQWSPESLLAWMVTGRPGVYRTTLVRELGGFRDECGSAYEYDLVLRLAARSPRVTRVPDVLYHRRGTSDSLDPLDKGARRALMDHLEETHRPGDVEPGPSPGLHQVRFALRGRPLISIIIASACRRVRVRGERAYYLLKCLESIRKSSWFPYEIIVLHGPRVPSPLVCSLKHVGAVHAAYDSPFNWSRAMNQGAALAQGQHLLFLNDDVEVITPDWLERLLEFSQQSAVGAVGAKLFFPSGRLQHAGVAVLDGRPRHPFYAQPGEHTGYFNNLVVPRNCSAVTGACLMTRAELFRSVDGFDEAFPLNYNDVDYCLRLITSGKRVVCTPYARLYHHELGTRPAEVRPEETKAMRQRWGESWVSDPYYNPNLSSLHFDYRIG